MTKPTTFPAHLDPTEGQIIRHLIDIILAKGGAEIRVYDGEGYATAWTRNIGTIRSCIATTEVTVLETRIAGKEVGDIILIHGNGEDVISDMQWSKSTPESETLMNQWCDVAMVTAAVEGEPEPAGYVTAQPERKEVFVDEFGAYHNTPEAAIEANFIRDLNKAIDAMHNKHVSFRCNLEDFCKVHPDMVRVLLDRDAT